MGLRFIFFKIQILYLPVLSFLINLILSLKMQLLVLKIEYHQYFQILDL